MRDYLIIPTYNERGNIANLLERVFALYPALHVLVVDDGSPDGTGALVKELQQKYPNLELKERSGKLGLASAYLGAMKEVLATHQDLHAIVSMDADFSHDPAAIKELLAGLASADLVVGSRYIPGGAIPDWSLYRRALSWGGNLYARLVTLSKVHDLTGGFNCYSAALLRQYDLENMGASGYGFQIEMKIVARNLGARIREIPIIFRDRTEGVSKISNRIIYEGLILPWRFSPLAAMLSRKARSR